jgi:hypothetical protein
MKEELVTFFNNSVSAFSYVIHRVVESSVYVDFNIFRLAFEAFSDQSNGGYCLCVLRFGRVISDLGWILWGLSF